MEAEADRRKKLTEDLRLKAGAPEVAPCSTLGLPSVAGREAPLGPSTRESRREGEVVLVNPASTGRLWKLRWAAPEGEGPGVVFSRGGSALSARTVGKGRLTRELNIPCGGQVSLRPTGGPESLKRIMLYASTNKHGVKNPFEASFGRTLVFRGDQVILKTATWDPALLKAEHEGEHAVSPVPAEGVH
jgi:hypothetical protein